MADESPSTSVAPLTDGMSTRRLRSKLEVAKSRSRVEIRWWPRAEHIDWPWLFFTAFPVVALCAWFFWSHLSIGLASNVIPLLVAVIHFFGRQTIEIGHGEIVVKVPLFSRTSFRHAFESSEVVRLEVVQWKRHYIVQAVMKDGSAHRLAVMKSSTRAEDLMEEVRIALGLPTTAVGLQRI